MAGPRCTRIAEFVKARHLIAAWGDFVQTKIDEGWSASLLTFEFDRLYGSSDKAFISQIRDEIEGFYRKILIRIVRRPDREECPILIGAPDRPVPKRAKKSPQIPPTGLFNDGLHAHGIFIVPPRSRLKQPLVDHIAEKQHIYADRRGLLRLIHAVPITEAVEFTTDYALKQLKRTPDAYGEELILLPKATSEMPAGPISPECA